MSFIISLIIKRRKYGISFFLFLLFLLTGVVVYRLFSAGETNIIRAQESTSISPTPSVSPSSSTPLIPDINPETLRDPAAFKLDQQIKQSTRLLFQALTSGDNTSISNQASQRKNLMKQAIQKYSYVFLSNALTSSQTSSFDSQIQEQYFERPLTLSNAELGVTHIDDFEKHENSRFDYSLQNLQEHKTFNFYPAGDFGGHISGTTLNVNGVALDEDITARVMAAPQGGGEENNDPVPTNIEILKEASPDATGPQRVAVILVYPKDIDTTNLSPKEQVLNDILNGNVQKFFKEVSYGKTWLDEENSHVYGWYELPAGTDPFSLGTNILDIADSDIDFTKYDRAMVGIPIRLRGRGSVGKGSFKDRQTGDARFSFTTFPIGNNYVFAHEFGHNLGINHAHSWDCDQGGVQGNCIHFKYGNRFDLMGDTGNFLRHFNGYFKEVFQWFNKPVTNITVSGRYKLQSLEYPEAVVAKISRPGASNFPIYYLETRLPVGFDDDTNDPNLATRNTINGIHINWVYKPLSTRFLTPNARNGSESLKQIEPLKQGQNLVDKNAGWTITNVDDTTIDVQFEEPRACTQNDFKSEELPAYAESDLLPRSAEKEMVCKDIKCVLKRKEGERVFISFRVKFTNHNAYTCPNGGNVNLTVSLASEGWQPSPVDPLSLGTNFAQISVNESGSFGMPMTFSPTMKAGIYRFNLVIKNTNANSIIFSTPKEVEIIDEFQMLEGDLTADGKVDIFDLVTVARDFGKKGEGLEGDANRDGKVDIFDLVIVAKNFGKKQ